MTNRLCLGLIPSINKFGMRVSLPGKDVLTATSATDFSFDSESIEQMNVIAAGDAYVSTTNQVGGYYLLTTFPTLAFVPNVWVFMNGVAYNAGVFGIVVTTSEIRMIAGDIYHGKYVPTDLVSYVVFNSSIAA